MTFQEKYPEAYEDDCGTVWIDKAASDRGNIEYGLDFANGDAFLNDILGWSMAEAIENWEGLKKINKRKALCKAHPHIRDAWWFVLRHYRFASMFTGTVWREWHGHRISWSLSWKLAGDTWLRGGK